MIIIRFCPDPQGVPFAGNRFLVLGAREGLHCIGQSGQDKPIPAASRLLLKAS
jgi:hypothetical protein